MFCSEHHSPAVACSGTQGTGRLWVGCQDFSLAVAPEHLAGLAGVAQRDSLHLAQGWGLLAAFKALSLSGTDRRRSLLCCGHHQS